MYRVYTYIYTYRCMCIGPAGQARKDIRWGNTTSIDKHVEAPLRQIRIPCPHGLEIMQRSDRKQQAGCAAHAACNSWGAVKTTWRQGDRIHTLYDSVASRQIAHISQSRIGRPSWQSCPFAEVRVIRCETVREQIQIVWPTTCCIPPSLFFSRRYSTYTH